MDKIIEKLNKALTESERDKLIGHLAFHYEMMRMNGTVGIVKDIYGNTERSRFDDAFFIDPSEKDPYVKEKTRKFFDCGAPFASGLDFSKRTNLGGVLYNYLLKEMNIKNKPKEREQLELDFQGGES
tara:strand:+ start:52 stop:432 length:381 start_codon:yes stop_codon:yes gene_type:complete